MGRYSFLVGRDKIHCHEPLDQADFCAFKNRAYQYGKVLSAFWATEHSVRPSVAMVLSAIGADIITVLPSLANQELLASLVVFEVLCQGDQAVELFQIYRHIVRVFHSQAKIVL